MKKNFYSTLVLLFGLVATETFAQQDSARIANLDIDKLNKIEEQIRISDSVTTAKIKSLETSITNKNFIEVLRAANTTKFKNDVSSLKGRFIAGEEILNHIIRETNSFNFSYQQLVLQSEFSALTNPTNYPEFTSPLANTLNSLKDKKPIPDISQDLSNLTSNIPYLNNPAVSSGLSIVSYFIAKYNDKRKFENENFKKMTCVLNFTSSTEADYKMTVQRIIYLRDKIEKYNSNIKEFFSQYLKAIGYQNGYVAYNQERTTNGSDFLEPTRKQFFNSILADTSAIGIVAISTDKDDNVSYYMEQVKFYIAEYESILRDIDNSIVAYDQFYTNLNNSVNASCDGIKSFARPKLTTIQENITRVKNAFKVVNEENKIPANLKRTLLGL